VRTVQQPKYKVNVNTMEHLAAKTLELNAIGVAECWRPIKPVVFDPYSRTARWRLHPDRQDEQQHRGVPACCTSRCGARRTSTGRRSTSAATRMRPPQEPEAGRAVVHRAVGFGQVDHRQPGRKKLHRMNRHTFLLDGDNVRHGLNKDLGFTEADRVENIRRVGEVAEADGRCRPDRHHRVHLAVPGRARDGAPLEVAESRDVKGLYKKARRGELRNFTGIDSPYEEPANPELRVNTVASTPEDAADLVIAKMRELGLIH
jgi:bifunctional enzyme CysN/CysC